MTHQFDELAKALAEGVSRREALRRVGAGLASTLLVATGLGSAWSQGRGGGGGGGGGSKGCPSGQTKCKGKCVNTSTDPQNCGGCGTTCRADQVCSGGVCQCPSTKSPCSGQCVDTASDANNCGFCGNVCTGGATCVSGFCQSGTCSPPCSSGFICTSIGTCCIPNGTTVTSVADCCSGGAASTNGGPLACLGRGPGASCSFSEQCDSSRGLTCGNGSCCYAMGTPCIAESLCCSGLCVPDASGFLFCS